MNSNKKVLIFLIVVVLLAALFYIKQKEIKRQLSPEYLEVAPSDSTSAQERSKLCTCSVCNILIYFN